ncbi:MAG: hypothetical protein ACRAS9_02330 [Mycoplasma sp.]
MKKKELLKDNDSQKDVKNLLQGLMALKNKYRIAQDDVYEALKYALALGFKNESGYNVFVEANSSITDSTLDFEANTMVVADDVEAVKMGQTMLSDIVDVCPTAQVGDKVLIKKFGLGATREWSRKSISIFTNVLNEQCRIKQLELLITRYKNRETKLVRGKIEGHLQGGFFVRLDDDTLCFLPKAQISPLDNLDNQPTQYIRAVISNVLEEKNKGKAQIILSRSNADFVRALFFSVVPELKEETIAIKAIARIPGRTTKIVVASNNSNVRALGTILGVNNDRINAVKSEINNENINIINWMSEENELIEKIIKPVRAIAIKTVQNDEGEEAKYIVVNDEELPLAFGSKRINNNILKQLYGENTQIVGLIEANDLGLMAKIKEQKIIQAPEEKIVTQKTTEIREEKTKKSTLAELKETLSADSASRKGLTLEEKLAAEEKAKKEREERNLARKNRQSKFVTFKKEEKSDEDDIIKKQNEILSKQYQSLEITGDDYNEDDYNEDVELESDFEDFYDEE